MVSSSMAISQMSRILEILSTRRDACIDSQCRINRKDISCPLNYDETLSTISKTLTGVLSNPSIKPTYKDLKTLKASVLFFCKTFESQDTSQSVLKNKAEILRQIKEAVIKVFPNDLKIFELSSALSKERISQDVKKKPNALPTIDFSEAMFEVCRVFDEKTSELAALQTLLMNYVYITGLKKIIAMGQLVSTCSCGCGDLELQYDEDYTDPAAVALIQALEEETSESKKQKILSKALRMRSELSDECLEIIESYRIFDALSKAKPSGKLYKDFHSLLLIETYRQIFHADVYRPLSTVHDEVQKKLDELEVFGCDYQSDLIELSKLQGTIKDKIIKFLETTQDKKVSVESCVFVEKLFKKSFTNRQFQKNKSIRRDNNNYYYDKIILYDNEYELQRSYKTWMPSPTRLSSISLTPQKFEMYFDDTSDESLLNQYLNSSGASLSEFLNDAIFDSKKEKKISSELSSFEHNVSPQSTVQVIRDKKSNSLAKEERKYHGKEDIDELVAKIEGITLQRKATPAAGTSKQTISQQKVSHQTDSVSEQVQCTATTAPSAESESKELGRDSGSQQLKAEPQIISVWDTLRKDRIASTLIPAVDSSKITIGSEGGGIETQLPVTPKSPANSRSEMRKFVQRDDFNEKIIVSHHVRDWFSESPKGLRNKKLFPSKAEKYIAKLKHNYPIVVSKYVREFGESRDRLSEVRNRSDTACWCSGVLIWHSQSGNPETFRGVFEASFDKVTGELSHHFFRESDIRSLVRRRHSVNHSPSSENTSNTMYLQEESYGDIITGSIDDNDCGSDEDKSESLLFSLNQRKENIEIQEYATTIKIIDKVNDVVCILAKKNAFIS